MGNCQRKQGAVLGQAPISRDVVFISGPDLQIEGPVSVQANAACA
jgi:hypothetical protein